MKKLTALKWALTLLVVSIYSLDTSAQWKEISHPFTWSEFLGLQTFGEDTVIVSTFAISTSKQSVSKTVDGGNNWSEIVDGASVFSFCNSKRGIYLKSDKVFQTTNSGNTWKEMRGFASLQNGIQIDDTSVIVQYKDGGKDQLILTTDNGAKWTKLNLPYDKINGDKPIIYDIQVKNINEIYIIGEDSKSNYNHIYATNDKGKSWSDNNTNKKYNLQNGFAHIKVVQDSIYMVTGQGEIEISKDYGKTWNKTSFFSKGGFYSANLLDYYNDKFIMASCTLSWDSSKVFAVTKDLGKNWEWLSVSNSTSQYDYVEKIAMFDSTVGYAISDMGLFKFKKTPCSNSIINFELGVDTFGCSKLVLDLENNTELIGYKWSTGDTTPTLNIDKSGSYSVEVFDKQMCSAIDTISVNIVELPVVTLNDTTVCGDSINLFPGVHHSYLWSDGSIEEQLHVDSSGVFWVEVVDTFGCSSMDTVSVEIIKPMHLSLGEDKILNKPFTLSIEAKVQADTYKWNNGDTTKSITVTDWGNYSVEVKNKCETKSDTIAIGYCEAAYYFFKDTSSLYSVTIVDTSKGANLNYIWSFGDGDTSHSTNPSHDYKNFGKYEVCLNVMNSNCSDIICDSIGLDSTGKLYKKTGFRINVIDESKLGITPFSYKLSDNLKYYPNPNNGHFFIRSDDIVFNKDIRLKIFNTLGEVIQHEHSLAHESTIEVKMKTVVPGIYFIEISQPHYKSLTMKLIVD